MKNKGNCVSVVSLTKTILLVFLVILPNLISGRNKNVEKHDYSYNEELGKPSGSIHLNEFSPNNFTYKDGTSEISDAKLADLIERTPTMLSSDGYNTILSSNSTNTSRSFLVPILTIPDDITIECSEDETSANTGEASATGTAVCGIITITQSDIETDDCGRTKTITRTWTATDECGDSISEDQIITVVDTTPPTLLVPIDITIECGEDESSSNTGLAKAEDQCGGVRISESDVVIPGCGNTKTIIRTWTATDNCGNPTTGDQTITVQDTTPPVLVDTNIVLCTTETVNGGFEGNPFTQRFRQFPENQVAGWSTTSNHNLIEIQRSGQINGNLSHSGNYHLELNGKGLDDIYQEFCSPSLGTLDITFFHKKRRNNNILNILELYAGSDLNNLSLIGTYSVDYASGWKENTVTYDVPEDQISTIVLFKAIQGTTNSVGNLLDDITVTANADIDANLPQDITVECNEIPEVTELFAIDNCGDATVTFEEAITPGSCENEYSLVRTWTAIDGCNNQTTYSQIITVQDTTPPTITAPNDVTIECGEDESSINTGEATGTDNCGSVIITQSDTEIAGCGNTKTIIRTWTVTDDCGNTVSSDQTITVEDTTAPVFLAPDTTSCEAETENGGFEGNIFSGKYKQFSENEVAGWNTTANHNKIEIQRSGQIDGNLSHSGNYHLELNGRALDDVYQEFCSPSLGTLNITFFHKKRKNNAILNILELYAGSDLNNLSLIGTYEVDYASGWKENTVTYNIPEDQISTIVLFKAIQGTTNSVGNLLDDISVTSVPNNSNGSLPEDITVECSEIPDPAILTATDNCGEATITLEETITPGSCDNEYSILRTWTATDDCNNDAIYTQTITVTDTTPPTFTVPENITLECDVDVTDLALTGDVVDEADNCSIDLEATYADSATVGSCDNETVIMRTWTLVDGCNNETSFVQTINLVDTTAPAFTVPEDITIECDIDVNDLTITGDVTNETDNCASDLEATYTDSITPGDCASDYVISRTWSLTDMCDNTLTLIQTINVKDQTAPTFTVPDDITIDCDADATDLTITGDVTDEADNCSSNLEATYIDTVTSGNCANESVIKRTWSLIDACDNTTSLIQTITVKDETPPTFTVPQDITIECDIDPSDLSITGDVTDENDNCDSNLEASFVDTIVDGECTSEFIITRAWSVEDDCGNSTILNQTITVKDTTPPIFDDEVPANITVECDAIPDLDTINASDNCGAATVTVIETITEGSCDNEYTLIRTWTAVDDCGNETIQTQTITVEDNTPPVFSGELCVTETTNGGFEANAFSQGSSQILEDSVPGWSTTSSHNRIEIQRSGQIDGNISHSGNYHFELNGRGLDDLYQEFCSPSMGTLDITFFHKKRRTNNILNILELYAGSDLDNLTLIGTYEVDNASGWKENTVTYSVPENQNSTIILFKAIQGSTNSVGNLLDDIEVTSNSDSNDVLPQDMTVECNEIPDAATLTATDNCGEVTVTLDETNTPGSCDNEYTLLRTWTATDSCNNQTIHTQTITVIDTTPPTFTVPNDITIDCDADASDLTLTGDVTDEMDNCATDLDATYSDSIVDGSCPGAFVITRTWSLTDACDNTTTLVQTINILDETAPTFTVPEDITVECDVDITDLLITGDVTDETDNCDSGLEAGYTDMVETGDCVNESIITRTWTLTDSCDNSTVLIQKITVKDETPPTFDVDLPSEMTLECDDIPATDTVTASDDCGDATVSVEESITDGDCDNRYTLVRTWTAVDECGNETIKTQTFTITDTTAPSFNEDLPEDENVECDSVLDAEVLTASDNCGEAEVTFEETITDGACAGDYIIERTWTATDACGNDSIHTQIITVEDNTAPILSPETPFDENITVFCDGIPERPELVFEDSCINGSNPNNISVVFDEVNGQINDFEDYEIIRTWEVTDDCGNQALFTQTISVEIENVINATDTDRCILDSAFDLFDLLSGDFETDGNWSVVSGDATLDGSFFDPSSVEETGDYTFKYSITEVSCPTEAEVTVTINDDCVVLPCGAEDVIISKTVTANGDNFNEFFTISGVDDCGFVVELQIFNRWGAEIYKSNNYQNDWNAEAHGSSAGNSGKVPTGTYYYVINLRNSGLEPFAGPIYVATNK